MIAGIRARRQLTESKVTNEFQQLHGQQWHENFSEVGPTQPIVT